jgi:hypothetical protein
MLKLLSTGSNNATTKGELLMKKLRSTLLSLTIVLALCLTISPIQVRAESGGPQNTSNSQSSGSSSLTLAQIAALIAAAIRLW